MPAPVSGGEDYQNIFHWAETQKDGAIPSFAVRKNDPYEVDFSTPHEERKSLTNTSTKRDSETSKYRK